MSVKTFVIGAGLATGGMLLITAFKPAELTHHTFDVSARAIVANETVPAYSSKIHFAKPFPVINGSVYPQQGQ